MILDYKNSAIRFTGRFAELDGSMTYTATGSAIEIAFSGESVLLKFDLENQIYPYPHLWLQIDGGAWFETQVDWYVRVNALNRDSHYLKIVLKSALEFQSRWNVPICAKLSFVSAEAEGAAELHRDNRKTIEILGDSIT